MYSVDASSPVMITGATGYVAGHIVKMLLDAGVTIHAAVRDPDNVDKLKYLNALAENSPGNIKYFKADLLDRGSYASAMAGCATVFHTASPFTLTVKDPQKDLVDPAQLGTRNVLEEANRTPSVGRVVLTSSCAAIYGDNADLQSTPNGVFTEETWNTTSSLDHQPYSYSKTVAEREAWTIADAQDRWDLVVINPSLVFGPAINPYATSESFNIIRQIGDGALRMGAPRMGMGVVDVHDVAEAHLAAAFIPEAKGRHIVSGHATDFLALIMCLAPKYGNDYPLPRRATPKWLFWLVAPYTGDGISRKFVSLNVDLPWKADNSKSIRVLGLSYRPMEDSMNEMFQQAIDAGLFKNY